MRPHFFSTKLHRPRQAVRRVWWLILAGGLLLLLLLGGRSLQTGSALRETAVTSSTLSGPMILTQADSGPPTCFFSVWPLTSGEIEFTIDDQTGAVSALLAGDGHGLRENLSCDNRTRSLRWDVIYDAEEIEGSMDQAGNFTLSGPDMFFLDGEWSWENCRLGALAVSCPPGEEFQESYDITVSGTINKKTGSGSGTIQVGSATMPTVGSWSVKAGGSRLIFLPFIRRP